MKRILIPIFSLFMAIPLCNAQKEIYISVRNDLKRLRTDVPIVINLKQYDKYAKSASITMDGQEVAYQMDDLDNDGEFDEICFLTDLDKNSTKKFDMLLFDTGSPKFFPARVYAEMLLKNPKNKTQNKQDTYISSLTVDGKANPYECLQHHGPAFESELNAYRVYFDERQTVDIYGKYRKGLELKETQFYPDKEQKGNGFGDDVLWVGSTMGLGTLRGWDGENSQTLNNVSYRTEKILAKGPLRTIVEVIDEGWKTGNAGKKAIDMTTRYTLYAGHRDCSVDIIYDEDAHGYEFATGIVNIKNSQEYSDKNGLRGCWGTDWPVSEKDSAGHKRETVGLGICIPSSYMKKELEKDADNYPFVISSANNIIHYDITFGSDNESYGFHTSKEWFKYLKEWKEELCHPAVITY